MVGLRENTPVETLTQRSDNVHHPLSGRDGSNLGKASFFHLIWQERQEDRTAIEDAERHH